jgi:murein L,D-transpeptidase YafK
MLFALMNLSPRLIPISRDRHLVRHKKTVGVPRDAGCVCPCTRGRRCEGAHTGASIPETAHKIRMSRYVRAVILCSMVASVFFPSGVQSQAFRNVQQAVSENGQKIIISKNAQTLELRQKDGSTRTFRVCLGLNPIGPKKITGDQKTPEGDYFICSKSTESRFHRFLGISYPGAADAQNAFEHGVISLDDRDAIIRSAQSGKAPPWNTKLGGWVGIHGYPTDWRKRLWVILYYPKPDNWTDGCVAMWNFEVEELFNRVAIGTPVKILP